MTEEFWRRRAAAATRVERAWYAALAHATILAVLGGMVVAAEGRWAARSAVPFVYVALLAALAAGTARRSRAAASLLLGLTVWVEGGTWWARHSWVALIFLVAFGLCYAAGVRGAVEWHRLERERRAAAGTDPAAAA